MSTAMNHAPVSFRNADLPQEISRHYREHHDATDNRIGRRVDYSQCAIISEAAAVALVGQAAVDAAKGEGLPEAVHTRAPRYDDWMPAAPAAPAPPAPPAPAAPPVPPPAPAAPAPAPAAAIAPPSPPGQIPEAVYRRAVPADSDTTAPLPRYLPEELRQDYVGGRSVRDKQARRRAKKPPVQR